MAGRHRFQRQPYNEEPRAIHHAPHHPYYRPQEPLPARHLEDEIALRRDEMRRIHADNQVLMDQIVSIRREMPLVKEEVRDLSEALPKVRAAKEIQSRELTQMNLKLEAELRSFEPLKAEAKQLRSEVQKQESLRDDTSANIQSLLKDLDHQKAEGQRVPALRAEADGLQQEILRCREAYDYEKKANPELKQQLHGMENDLVSMAQEVEKLKAELAKKRAPGSSAGSHGANPEGGYSGLYGQGYGSSTGSYGSAPWAPYDYRGFPHH